MANQSGEVNLPLDMYRIKRNCETHL